MKVFNIHLEKTLDFTLSANSKKEADEAVEKLLEDQSALEYDWDMPDWEGHVGSEMTHLTPDKAVCKIDEEGEIVGQ